MVRAFLRSKMTAWTEEKAVEALEGLATQARDLSGGSPGSEEFTRWQLRALTTLEDLMGSESNFVRQFKGIRWTPGRVTGLFQGFRQVRNELGPMVARARRGAYLSGLERAAGILLAARDHVEARGFS